MHSSAPSSAAGQRLPRAGPGPREAGAFQMQHRAAGPDGVRRPAQDGGLVPFGVYFDQV
jgi:hypothetical protein